MKNKQITKSQKHFKKMIKYKNKYAIYNSLIIGDDAFDDCMSCALYCEKCAGDGTNKHCRYKQVKIRNVFMKKIYKSRKKYQKDINIWLHNSPTNSIDLQ